MIAMCKICTICKESKPATEYYKRHSFCKPCAIKRAYEWRAKKLIENPVYVKYINAKHYIKHKQKITERCKRYKDNNKGKYIAYLNKRRALQLKAVPKWANSDKINDTYKQAKHLTKTTGIKYVVDHIVPLISPLVCGLHCEQNLQIISEKENLVKSNAYWPDMP